jgi:hypothetical protein
MSVPLRTAFPTDSLGQALDPFFQTWHLLLALLLQYHVCNQMDIYLFIPYKRSKTNNHS